MVEVYVADSSQSNYARDTNLCQGFRCSNFYQDISDFYCQQHALCSSLYGRMVIKYCHLPSLYVWALYITVVGYFCDLMSSEALIIKIEAERTLNSSKLPILCLRRYQITNYYQLDIISLLINHEETPPIGQICGMNIKRLDNPRTKSSHELHRRRGMYSL
jgi:hypothetical protein